MSFGKDMPLKLVSKETEEFFKHKFDVFTTILLTPMSMGIINFRDNIIEKVYKPLQKNANMHTVHIKKCISTRGIPLRKTYTLHEGHILSKDMHIVSTEKHSPVNVILIAEFSDS